MEMDRKTSNAQSEKDTGASRSESKPDGKRLKRKKPSDVQFASIIEQINEGFVALDGQMNYVYINKRGSEIMQREREHLIGKSYWDEYPEDKNTPFGQAYVRALETKTPIELEDYYAARDRWFENRIYPSEEGGLSIFFNDITERKRAEAAMRESEERFQTLANGSPVLLWVNGLEGCEFVNREYLDFLGLAAQTDVQGYDWSRFVHPEDREAYQNAYLRAFEKQAVFSAEFRFRRHDGDYRWMRSEATPRRGVDGSFLGYVGASIDITVRKRAELALQKSEHQLRLITDAMPALISYIDSEYRYRFVNRTYRDWFGYESEEVLDKTAMEVLGAAAFERLHPHMEAALAGKTDIFETETPYQRGGTRFIRATYTPDIAADGTVNGFFVLVLDITERKQAEEALAEYARQQAALYQLTDRLQHTKSREDIFNAALDAILSALRCDRASILLFDKKDVMSFVAWRGLSDEYRKATEGHSPWKTDEKNPEPICMNDVDEAELSDSLRTVIQQEGIGALAFFPLVFNGTLIGKFMAYFNEPHTFTERETELSLMIARQLAISIERKRDEDALRTSEASLRLATQTARMFSWEFDIQKQAYKVADNFFEAVGFSSNLIPKDNRQILQRYIHSEDTHLIFESLTKALESRSDLPAVQYRLLNPETTQPVWLEMSGKIVYDRDGNPERMFGVAQNITESKQTEAYIRYLNTELQAQLDEMHTLLNILPTGVWIGNHDCSEITGNPAAYKILGFEPGVNVSVTNPEAKVPTGLRLIVNGEEVTPENAPMQVVARSGKPWHGFEHELLFADGTHKSIYGSVVPIFNEHGAVRKVIASYTDFTQRKQAESHLVLLAEVSELTRQIEDPIELMYTIAKAVGQHLQVKRCLFNETDVERDIEIVHKDFHDGVESVAGEHRISDYSSITSAEMASGKTVVNHDSKLDPRTEQDYERTYALSDERAYVAVPLMRENRWVGTLWVSDDRPRQWSQEDISLLETIAERTWNVIEKLRINNELRAKEAELEKIINGTPFMLTRCSRDLRYQFVSLAYARMIGRTPAEITGKAIAEIMGEEGLNTITPHIERVLSGKRVEYESDILFQGVGTRSLHIVYTPDQDEQENVVGWFASIVDITERKRMEDERSQLLQQEKELRAKAEQAKVESEQAKAEAERELAERRLAEAALGEWADVPLAHETRPAWLRYGVAVAITALAIILRVGLQPILGDFVPLATLFGAVTFSVWFGGVGPAILSVIVGYLGSAWLILDPRNVLVLDGKTIAGLGLFLLSNTVIISLGQAMRRAQRHAHQSALVAVERQHQAETRLLEKQHTEEALRRSEQMFSTLVDASPFGVYFIDSDFRLRAINKGSEAVFKDIDPLIGRDFAEILHIIWQEPFASEAIARFRHTLDTGESFISPPIIEQRGNIDEIEAYDWQIHRITLSDGTYGVVCYFYDLSEQKQMEATVRASEELYRTIARSIPGGGIYVIDKDFRYLVAEGPVTDAFGLTREMLEGHTVSEVFPAEPAEKMEARLRRNFAGETVDFETRHNDRFYWTQQAPLVDSLGNVIVVTLDITDRKLAEEALRESERKFSLIFHKLPFAAALSNPVDGTLADINEAFERVFGYTRQEALGKTSLELGINPDAENRSALFAALQGQGSVRDLELELVTKPLGARIFLLNLDMVGIGEEKYILQTAQDITERKQAEEALKRSEERFARFMQYLPGLAWIKDREGRYVYANVAAEKAFNTPRDILYGRTDEEIFPAETAAQFRRNDELALIDEKGVQVTETMQQDDGILHYSLVNKFPIPGSDGNTTLIGGTAFDITERKQAEEALRESEERFRAILSQATAGIVRKDAEGKFIFVNEAFCNMLGYSETELRGKTIWHFTYPDDLEENKRLYDRAMVEGIPFKLEKRLIRKDGSIVWVDVSVSPILEATSKPQSAVAVEVDITRRKQAEEALRESKELYRNLFETVPVAVYTCDANGLIQEFNHQAVELWGREPKKNDPDERFCGSFKIYYPDGRFMPHEKCPMARMLRGETLEPQELEILVERPDGSRRNIIPHPRALKNERGEIVGAINCLYDFTERKRAEEELHQLNLQLEGRVQKRTTELLSAIQSLRGEISERQKAEDALHESRNRLQVLSQRLVDVQEEERRAIARELHDRVGQSLSALNINLVILDNQISSHVPEQIRVRLDDSMKLVAETINLVRDVMSDLRPPVLDDYGLEAALQSQISAFRNRYGIKVQFDKPEQPLPRLAAGIEMTFVRIAQEALMNIARHAKASQVTLSLKQEENAVRLVVQDDGEGIRSWQEANRPGSHGLNIMRERAEAFGGDLTVSSTPGKGVKVDASIPIDFDESEDVEQESNE